MTTLPPPWDEPPESAVCLLGQALHPAHGVCQGWPIPAVDPAAHRRPHPFAPLTFGWPDGPAVTDWCGYAPGILHGVEEVCGKLADDPVHADETVPS